MITTVGTIESYARGECVRGIYCLVIHEPKSYDFSHESVQAFSSLSSITFKGTKAQWDTMIKEGGWNSQVPATVVHCSDEDVNL